MPYGGNETPEQVEKIESCVSQVVAKGRKKDEAVAICKTAILGSAGIELEAATQDDIIQIQAELGENSNLFSMQGSVAANTILKFSRACLAREEVNKNRDGITKEGISQLANTIRLLPLTYEHNKDARGIFTRGYVSEDGTECLVDGLVFFGMFPEFTEEIRSGERRLSIDAEADLAVCSICGQPAQALSEYCEHLQHHDPDAIRWLFDLRSVAGGAVRHPAGTGTIFPGREGFSVISCHEEEPEIKASLAVEAEAKKPQKRKGAKPKVLGGNSMEVTCPECNHEYEIATEAEKIQAELDETLAKLEAQESTMAEFESTNTELQSNLDAEVVATERFAELVAKVGVDTAKEALPSLRKVDDETFGIMISMATIEPVEEPAEEEEEPSADPPPKMVAADEDPPPATEDSWDVEI